MENLLNPSKEASTISPGRRLKNFLPALEFATELAKNPETLTTPESIPFAIFSDIFVNFFTLELFQTLIISHNFLTHKTVENILKTGIIDYLFILPSVSGLISDTVLFFPVLFFKNSFPHFNLSTVISPHHNIPFTR